MWKVQFPEIRSGTCTRKDNKNRSWRIDPQSSLYSKRFQVNNEYLHWLHNSLDSVSLSLYLDHRGEFSYRVLCLSAVFCYLWRDCHDYNWADCNDKIYKEVDYFDIEATGKGKFRDLACKKHSLDDRTGTLLSKNNVQLQFVNWVANVHVGTYHNRWRKSNDARTDVASRANK